MEPPWMWRLSILHLGVLFLPTQVIISVSCGGGLADVDIQYLHWDWDLETTNSIHVDIFIMLPLLHHIAQVV